MSFEGIARGVTALRGLRGLTHRSISTVSSLSSGGSCDSLDGDEDASATSATETTKAAVLSRSSTVHRSLPVNTAAHMLKRYVTNVTMATTAQQVCNHSNYCSASTSNNTANLRENGN